jgi:hypothetical protein
MTQTKFKLNRKALFGAMVLAAAGVMPAHAATLTVDPAAVDAAVAGDGKCSLREAVLSVNAGANVGDCAAVVTEAYGTNDTITLPAGTYNLTVTGLDESATGTVPPFAINNTPNAAVGDLDLMKSVRIVGAGADTTIIQWDAAVVVDETLRDRIFHVYTIDPLTLEVKVAIEGVTIQGGRTFEDELALQVLNPVDTVLYDYYFRRAGAGLAVGAAANVAQINPLLVGDENAEGRGGSQRPTDSDEGGATFSLTLTGVKVRGNQAQGDGAGIYTASPMTATNVVVAGNVTTINGGGIYNEGATTISNSTISDNIAEGGGGIFMTGSATATVNISGTTLSGNRAVGGGAISGRSGMTVKIVNSTLSGNIGSDVGAGLYTNGSAELNFVTIANNLAGADSPTAGSGINVFPASTGVNVVTLKNVLLAANKKGWVDGMDAAAIAALPSANCGVTGGGIPVTSLGNNLSSDASCDGWLTVATDKKNVDPKIGALASNGGLTLTHALLAGSPALGAGAADATVTVDQRGVTRETPPDIGAFEFVTPAAPATSGGGGGCAIGGDGRFDPSLPAMLAATLAFLGWRRRTER